MSETMSGSWVSHRLTVSEAAKASGKASSTIRRWINTGILKASRDSEGIYSIAHEDLMITLSRMSHGSTTSAPMNERPRTVSDSQLGYESLIIEEMRRSLSHERDVNKELREQVRNLEGELIKLTSEIKAILTRESSSSKLSRWIQSVAK